jgi:hypothetical protein
LKIIIEYDSEEERHAGEHFLHWLCGQGEQDYWLWMEYREQENVDGKITLTSFHYNFEKLFAKPKIGRLDER